jgi:hypothetical protein
MTFPESRPGWRPWPASVKPSTGSVGNPVRAPGYVPAYTGLSQILHTRPCLPGIHAQKPLQSRTLTADIRKNRRDLSTASTRVGKRKLTKDDRTTAKSSVLAIAPLRRLQSAFLQAEKCNRRHVSLSNRDLTGRTSQTTGHLHHAASPRTGLPPRDNPSWTAATKKDRKSASKHRCSFYPLSMELRNTYKYPFCE